MTMEEREIAARRRAEERVIAAFARIDAVAMGCAFGAVAGLTVFAATIILVAKGGEEIGPRLALLGQYFPGYTVTLFGSLVGLAYGAAAGFCGGWLLATLRNLCNAVYLNLIRVSSIHDVID